MKQHLNTLFITTQGAYLAKEGAAVAVRIERKTQLRVPLLNLGGIVCFGQVGCSPALLGACAEAGITVSLLDMYGRFRAAVVGFAPGNVLLRRQQYRMADDQAQSCRIARLMVAAKITNCRSVLLRGLRDHGAKNSELAAAESRLAMGLGQARTCESLDSLRGIEGESAAQYFNVFRELIAVKDEAFSFKSRSRRPPLDPVNSLLSFCYSLLAHDARSACEAAGLDAAVGFLHRDRPGRPGLALDLMEEFRSILADRLVLSLLNRKQVRPADFTTTPSGAVQLSADARKTVLVAFQKRKQVTILHPFLREKTTVGLLLHLQARLLARHLRGDIDGYPPFVWR